MVAAQYAYYLTRGQFFLRAIGYTGRHGLGLRSTRDSDDGEDQL